jgi:O-antigen/teichoic acid export membrane protein
VVDFALVVTTALIFSNVWALVIGFIVGDLMRLILSYVLHRYRPHFYFDVKKAKELFRFGKWIFGSNAVSFLLLQGDSIFVGKLLNIVSLGFYQMSSKVSSITGAEVLGGAIFPAYSKIQHDKEKMRQAYIKTLKLLLFVLAPIAAGIIAVAPEFTQLFLGSQWLPSVPAMRVLTLAGFLWAFAVVTVPVFSAIGKPHIETNYNILRLVVLFALLYPFIKLWGIVGASCAVLAGVLICVAGMSISAIIILNCKWGVYVKTIAIPVINSALMLSFVVVIKSFIDVNRLSFFLIVLYGVISYGVLVFLSEKLLRYHMLAVIKENIKLLLA